MNTYDRKNRFMEKLPSKAEWIIPFIILRSSSNREGNIARRIRFRPNTRRSEIRLGAIEISNCNRPPDYSFELFINCDGDRFVFHPVT